MKENRRNFIKKSASLTAALSIVGLSSCSSSAKSGGKNTENAALNQSSAEWPITFGSNEPKLCVSLSRNASVKDMRRVKQIGVEHILMGGPPIPWTESELRGIMDRFSTEGLTVINMMIGEHPNAIYGREGRDEEIRKIQESLRAAGAAGLPVVEYNFYAHRLLAGYYEIEGRGGAGLTGFDYDRASDIVNDKELLTTEMLWDNLTYFLKAIIPVAEEVGVRLALHPNDPPIPIAHGHAQIMATFNDWKRLIDIIDSPSNGMTYDCGVSGELGEDPLEILRYLGSRDRINHIHYRNVLVDEPYVKYREVFVDEGQVDMLSIMREIYKLKYKFGIYPEHPRALDYDKEHPEGIRSMYPGGGGYTGEAYNVAYTKAMMQAAVTLDGKS